MTGVAQLLLTAQPKVQSSARSWRQTRTHEYGSQLIDLVSLILFSGFLALANIRSSVRQKDGRYLSLAEAK